MLNNDKQKSCILLVTRNFTPSQTTASNQLKQRPITIYSVRNSIEMVSDQMSDTRYSSNSSDDYEMDPKSLSSLSLMMAGNNTANTANTTPNNNGDLLKCHTDQFDENRNHHHIRRLSNDLLVSDTTITRSTTLTTDETTNCDFGKDATQIESVVNAAIKSQQQQQHQNRTPKYCCKLEVKFVWYGRYGNSHGFHLLFCSVLYIVCVFFSVFFVDLFTYFLC